jgi:hypothetical protein
MASKGKKGTKRPHNEVEEDEDDEPISLPTVKGEKKIIVLLDKANLETTKTKKNEFELLNCKFIGNFG